MGIESVRAGKLARFSVALLAIATLLGACDNNDSNKAVSSGGFLAPFDDGLRVLVDKIDILGPIEPTLLTSEVRQKQANPVFMQILTDDKFLIYESQSRAIESIRTNPMPQR